MKKLFVALVILSTSVSAQANLIEKYYEIYDSLTAQCYKAGQQSGLIIRVLATQSEQAKESDKRKMLRNLETNASLCNAVYPDWAYGDITGAMTQPLEQKKVFCYGAGKEVASARDKIEDAARNGKRAKNSEEVIRNMDAYCGGK